MPIALEPGQRIAHVLKFDTSKPDDQQPTFFTRSLTAREQIEVQRKMDVLPSGTGDTVEAMEAGIEVVAGLVVDWENVTDPSGEPIPFDPKKLADVCTMSEIFELYAVARYGITPPEKKSSG